MNETDHARTYSDQRSAFSVGRFGGAVLMDFFSVRLAHFARITGCAARLVVVNVCFMPRGNGILPENWYVGPCRPSDRRDEMYAGRVNPCCPC